MSPGNESARQGPVPGESSEQMPEKAKSALPKPGAAILLFTLFLSLGLRSSTIAWSLQPRLPLTCTPSSPVWEQPRRQGCPVEPARG